MTDEFPRMAILLMTYTTTEHRTDYALRTIEAMQKNLNYPNYAWYVAESGDHDVNYNRVVDAIGKENLVGTHFGAPSPGESWNRGIRGCYEHAEIYLRLEDDWVLNKFMDIRPYMKLLATRTDVGMVRFGYMTCPNYRFETFCCDGIHYLRHLHETAFNYGGHPALIHRRVHDKHGYMNESLNPGEIEIDFDNRFSKTNEPSSVRPAEIGGWGVFHHIGEKKSY